MRCAWRGAPAHGACLPGASQPARASPSPGAASLGQARMLATRPASAALPPAPGSSHLPGHLDGASESSLLLHPRSRRGDSPPWGLAAPAASSARRAAPMPPLRPQTSPPTSATRPVGALGTLPPRLTKGLPWAQLALPDLPPGPRAAPCGGSHWLSAISRPRGHPPVAHSSAPTPPRAPAPLGSGPGCQSEHIKTTRLWFYEGVSRAKSGDGPRLWLKGAGWGSRGSGE